MDVGFGGAFYAVVPAARVGLDLGTATVRDMVDWAERISAATRRVVKLLHPTEQDLEFLYGTILTDGTDGLDGRTAHAPRLMMRSTLKCLMRSAGVRDHGGIRIPASLNVCVFADGQVDRSPTGSGVQTRMALYVARAKAAGRFAESYASPWMLAEPC